MKTVISILTLTVGLAFTVPAFAQEHWRGWSDIKVTTADNTYTGKSGSKRD